MSNVEEIKARVAIEDIVSESGVQLRRAGKNLSGFCPFHSNTRTPSFVVFPESGTWRCFGQCNEGGDVFKYVMKKEGLDFAEALRRLADRAGIQLRAPSPGEQAAKEQHGRLRAVLEATVRFYQAQLQTPAGARVLAYLHGRSLTDETIAAFELGYAPEALEPLSAALQAAGFTLEEMLEAGVLSQSEDGRRYPRFRHRLMFPIRDANGKMAGFGARALSEEALPKYLNSAQNPLFDKGNLLYGMDKARKHIRSQDEAVLVEGYMDVIALHQAGYPNAVSPMGTALGEQQLRALKRLSTRIVLALDADAAGDKATLRGLEVARKSLDRQADPVFDARGLLRHEGRLQADIRVTTLPEGKDPDEIVAADPAAWPGILQAARPIVEHVMYSLAAGKDLQDAKVKQALATQILPLIADVPSPVERDSYTQKLARLLQVDERSLMAERPRRAAPRARRSQAAAKPPPLQLPVAKNSLALLEAHCLSLLIRHPESLYRADRALLAAGLPRLSQSEFEHSDHQELFRLVREALEQNEQEPNSYVMQQVPPALFDRVEQLIKQSEKLDPQDDKVFEDLLRTFLLLRRRVLHKSNEQMRFLQQEAQQEGDPKASEYQQLMVQNTLTLRRLDQALANGPQTRSATR